MRGAFVVAAMSCGVAACDPAPGETRDPAPGETRDAAPVETADVCSGGLYHCYAKIQVDATGHRRSFALPSGYGPADLASAYNIPTQLAPGATVGLIGAYGYANIESDLAMYRSTFGLPPCTIASGCLTVLNQEGQPSPLPGAPPPNDDWTQETALDMDMASA
ncbi:MAG TPA: hypothetical protein VLX92_09160, partial [Kofleriaceae bacterium]|nr:hypothetical protein [Kofleriaceae bacterium]